MITNFKKYSRSDDIKLLIKIILAFLLVAWLCSPPGNKILQVCFLGNNTKLFMTKMFNNNATKEYLVYRNNAVYLAKMYPKDKKKAISEINKAIAVLPTYANEKDLLSLYKDRAYIKLYIGDYRGALSDFINSKNIEFNDNLTVAMLFKEMGNYKEALKYCNDILDTDSTAYAGFACLADIYNSLDRPDISIRLWDLAIDRRKNNARAYADRAMVKKSIGDFEGYEQDLKKAREYSPNINIEDSITHNALHPKILTLTIK